MLVDAHAHLFKVTGYSPKNVLILNTGLDFESNKEVLEYEHKGVYRALGGHPSSADKIDSEAILKQLEENLGKFHAVGEIGLDRHYNVDFTVQKNLFHLFLEFASKNKLPVVVHSRKAESEVIDTLSSYKLKVLLHSFGGKKSLVIRGSELNYYFGIPSILYKSSHHQMIAKTLELNYIITETDSPWQAPIVGGKNTPDTVEMSIKKIAELKTLSKEEVENKIENNFKKFLGIK